MHVTYRYPALIYAKARSASGSWRRIISMTGAAHIPELSDADAPVAVNLPVLFRGRPDRLRFHNGRFYQPTEHGVFNERRCGLEKAMATAICEHVRSEKAYSATMVPKNAAPGLWSLWQASRNPTIMNRHAPYLQEPIWEAMKPFNEEKHDGDLLADWHEKAAAYVSSLILVEDSIWIPVDEPMMRHHSEWRTDDASCYRNARGRPSDLPAPYGTADTLTSSIDHLHPYWNAAHRYVSIPEAVALAETGDEWLGDVIIPEAFTIDHATLQLDRAARVTAMELARVAGMSSYAADVELSGPLKKAFMSLRRLTRQAPDQQDGDILDGVLGNVLDYMEAEQYYIIGQHAEDSGVPGMIRTARERWAQRPITLQHEFSSIGPAFGR